MTRPLRVVVCGTNFGRLYLAALRALPAEFLLVGVVSRGGVGSRAVAAEYGVPHYEAIDQVPDGVDLACVVVGSTISGGPGTELAKAFLARGVHVLQEHPVHHTELVECLRLARQHRVQYRVNTHYPHVAPVRIFLAAAARLRKPLFVDAAGPVHVLLPLVDILTAALGGVRPWRFDEPLPADGPLRTVTGALAGVPLTLRVQNQLDPGDRDNYALLWHRIALGTDRGVLTLADTHGPVLWSPRLPADRDGEHRLLLDLPPVVGAEPSTAVLPGSEPGPLQEIFTRLWPDAIGWALRSFASLIEAADDPLRTAQRDITVCRIWTDLTRRLGPPTMPDPAPRASSAQFRQNRGFEADPDRSFGETAAAGGVNPPVLAELRVEERAEGEATGGGIDAGYEATAEFFDLVAAGHVRASAAVVIEALAGADPRHGPVIEIGAGTGLMTAALAAARPDLEIIASEPAAGMRAVLASRVFADEDLRHRVTVTAEAAPALELPDSICAAVVCGVAGHLAAAARATLWRQLVRRLPPGGVIMVELMAMDRPVTLAPLRLATTRLGQQDYEWWFEGEPAGDDLVRLRTTWRVRRDDDLLREVTDGYRWCPLTLDRVAAEAGLPLTDLTPPGAQPIGALTLPSTSERALA